MKGKLKAISRSGLSKRTGVKGETIRYYEKVGLIPEPERSENGYRKYDETHVKRLFFIKRCRELGFPQKEIGSLLGLVDGRNYTCNEIQKYALTRINDIDARIQDLNKIKQTLTDLAARCGGERVPECPILEALFA